MDNRNLYIGIGVLLVIAIGVAFWYFVISPIINTGPGKQSSVVYNRSGAAVYNRSDGRQLGGSYNQPYLNLVQPGSTPSYIGPGNNRVSGSQYSYNGFSPLGNNTNLPYLNINQPGSIPSYINH